MRQLKQRPARERRAPDDLATPPPAIGHNRPPPDVPVWGVTAIARLIGRTPRSTYHLLATGALPAARKIANRWTATPRALLSQWEDDDARR